MEDIKNHLNWDYGVTSVGKEPIAETQGPEFIPSNPHQSWTRPWT